MRIPQEVAFMPRRLVARFTARLRDCARNRRPLSDGLTHALVKELAAPAERQHGQRRAGAPRGGALTPGADLRGGGRPWRRRWPDQTGTGIARPRRRKRSL